MANYFEYTTVNAVRSTYLATTGIGDDTLMLELVRDVSRTIDRMGGHRFAPMLATRYFDAIECVSKDGLILRVDPFDLLAVGTITNGDTDSIASTEYVFEPRHNPPYNALRFKSSLGLTWTYQNDPENAITLANCVWGWHDDYTNAWQTLTTLGAALNNSATSATLAASIGNGGDLLKIDSEYLYLSARSGTTATIVRGVNGSTAAAHDNGATITRWELPADISQLAREAVAAKYRLRENPIGETIVIDGQSFATPKDVDKYIKARLETLGLVRQ